ncbi:hypothetical protein [Agromyces sp. LHK192]|uniref:hypothetical protein n=1 Tax=Agromyces sp. LHK192 TaxID=2498704 RepID=UPI000FDA945D|nr:hypothetical protein [Agromyces sp. LHK192]
MIWSRGSTRRRGWLGLAAVATAGILVVGGSVVATAASQSPTYRGCVNQKTGVLRVLQPGKPGKLGSCITEPAVLAETPITWNQQGPAGIPGPTGPAGATEVVTTRFEHAVPVFPNDDRTLLELPLGGGSAYQVTVNVNAVAERNDPLEGYCLLLGEDGTTLDEAVFAADPGARLPISFTAIAAGTTEVAVVCGSDSVDFVVHGGSIFATPAVVTSVTQP